MALLATTVWELRTTGTATAGGGFSWGVAGTDYSLQDSPQISVTDAVAAGTTTITSATANFPSDCIGNLIYLAGGSGSLAATVRRIVSRTLSTSIVVDATVATGTGITLNMGGAQSSLAFIKNNMVGSNIVFIKDGGATVYDLGTGVSFSPGNVTPSNLNPATRLIGYFATRGDILINTSGNITVAQNFTHRPKLRVTAGSTNSPIILSSNGMTAEFLDLSYSGAATGMNNGLYLVNNYCRAIGCKVASATAGIGIRGDNSDNFIEYCEVTTCSGPAGIQNNGPVRLNWSHDHSSSCTGIHMKGNGECRYNIISNCDGATGDGIIFDSGINVDCHHNVVFKTGRDAIQLQGTNYDQWSIQGNILASAGRTATAAGSAYGINQTTGAGIAASWQFDGNVYYNNKTANRLNLDDTGTICAQNAAAPYTNVLDVSCSVDPFTASGSNDFSLNNTANGGALARQVAPELSWPGITSIGYPDMGAVQHQATNTTTNVPQSIGIRGGFVN